MDLFSWLLSSNLIDVWTIKIYIPLSDFAGHTHLCPKDYGGKIFLKFFKKVSIL